MPLEIRSSLEPALRQFMTEIGPGFMDLMGEIGDLSAYHAPEVLPNGDILIRKRRPGEEDEGPRPLEEGEIEL